MDSILSGYCYLRNVQDFLAEGKKLLMKDDLENHSKGRWFLLEQWLNIIRFQREINQDFINLARKFYLEYELIAGRTWKGDTLIADLKNLQKDARIGNLSSKNQCKRSIDATKGRQFLPIAHGTAKLVFGKADHEFRESALRQEQPVRSEDLSFELQGEPEGPQPT